MYLRMETLVVQLSITSTLAHDDMQINTNLALLVFSKEYTTIIGTIYGGTITRDDALEGLTYTDQRSTLYTKRPRPLEVMRLNSPKAVLARPTLSK